MVFVIYKIYKFYVILIIFHVVAPQFILSWQARRFIRKLQKQMPCGWPQYGIPPLAPLKVREAEISLKKGILE